MKETIKLAGFAVAMASVAGLLGDLHWRLELATHWLLQLAVLGGGLAGLLAAARAWRWCVPVAAAAVLAAGEALPVVFGDSPAADPPPPDLTIFYANVLRINEQSAALAEQIAQSDPDVVFLVEVSPRWLSDLEPVLSGYTERLEYPLSESNFGVAFYSRLPVEGIERFDLGEGVDIEIPAVVAWVVVEGTPVRVFGLHAAPPAAPRYAWHRDVELAEVGARVAAGAGAAVVVGDLNTTGLATGYQRFLETTGLRDAREGRGLLGTWPAGFPAGLRIPIDHVLVSENLTVSWLTVGPVFGSDHLPLSVGIALGP